MSNNTEVWKQASEVFAEVSELSPQQALSHIYGIKNLTLEVREAVITLINAGSQASVFFEKEILSQIPSSLYNNHQFTKGQKLNEYELIEEIGRGGMSQVFKAKRVDAKQQTFVAIKIFAPKNNSKSLFEHFINEQKILADLAFPNIVKMLHSGITQDNISYLVMELIENAQPIDQFCKNKKLSTKQKIGYIKQCADALAYSHANLIIHRDLKPDNILINDKHQLKIVDFGIAKLINNDITGNKTTILALTPGYAAPEQINSKPISIKTDIFSLAVVTLDLLCESNPLPEDRLLKSCANDEQHLDKLISSLTFDKDLKNILQKSLAQDPDKRYSSMQSFADDLNNYLTDQPVNATSQSLFYRVQKFAKRRSALFATLVSFCAFFLIGSAITFKQYQQIKIEGEKAQKVKEFLLDSFAVTDPNYSQGLTITAQDILNSASEKLENNKNLDLETKFELLQTIGLSYRKIGFPNKAVDFLRKSLAISPDDSTSIAGLIDALFNTEKYEELNSLFEKLNIDSLSSITDQSTAYRIKGLMQVKKSEFEQAQNLLDKALNLAQKGGNIEALLLSKLEIANMYFEQSKIQEAIDYILVAIDMDISPTNTTLMLLKSDLGKYYYRKGNIAQCITVLSKLEKLQREILGNHHPALALTLNQLADATGANGNLDLAQLQSKESYQIYLNKYGSNSIKTAAVLNSLSIINYRNGNLKKSIEQMYQVKDIFEKINPSSSTTLEVKSNLAALLSHDNRNQEAATIAREVYTVQLEKLGPYSDSTLYSQAILAGSLAKSGQIDEGLTLAKLANKNALEHLDLTNSTTGDTFTALGKIYKLKKNYPAGISNFKELLNKGIYKTSNPRVPSILVDIAQLYALNNDEKNAGNFFNQAIDSSTSIHTAIHEQTIRIRLLYAKFLSKTNATETLVKEIKIISSLVLNNNILTEDIVKDLELLKKR